eukprot:Anaeramoba_ignava/a347514_13.p1 GENE.a347514_13~~a347514_13.p1  ORF type:complete len:440 (+),score=83.00 a347514_13:204-1523(+)
MNMKKTLLILICLIASAVLFSASVATNVRSGNMYKGQYDKNKDKKELRDKATKCYTEALEVEQDLPEVMIRLAELKVDELKEEFPDDNEVSEEYYTKLLEIRPLYTKALELLNNLPDDKKERKKALKTFRLKDKKVSDPRAKEGERLPNISIIEAYKFISKRFIDLGVDATVLRVAQLLNNDGKSDEAEKVLNKLLEVNPAYDSAILYLARMKYNKQKYESYVEAISKYKDYLKIKPDDIEVQKELAGSYTMLLEEDPADKTGYVKLYGDYVKEEHLKTAIDLYKNVLSLGKDSAIEYRLGVFYISLDDSESAVKYFEESISDNSDENNSFFDQACFSLSYLYQVKLNDDQRSIDFLKKGIDYQVKNEGNDGVKIEISRLKTLASNLFKAKNFAEAEKYAEVLYNKAIITPDKEFAKTVGSQSALKLKDDALSKKWKDR